MEVAKHVDNAEGRGRKALIPLNSEPSALLRQLFLKHYDLPIKVVTRQIIGYNVA